MSFKMATYSVDLSIVIPAYNEEKTIGLCIAKAHKALMEIFPQTGSWEIIVADNASTDTTSAIAKELGARVEYSSSKGYGNALISGIRAARGKFVIFADADDSYSFDEIKPFYDKLKEGFNFVIGNRFKGIIEKGAMPFLHRYLGTPVLTAVMNLFFKTGIGDCNCGMRGLTNTAFCKMRLRAAGMEFATEMIIKASLLKLKIAEVPCNLYRDKRDRKPHLRTWQDGWRHLRFMLLFTPTWTFLIPGFTLLGLGLIGIVFFLCRDTLDPPFALFLNQKHILSSMLLFLFGGQIVGLGLIAKVFSYSKHFDHTSPITRFIHGYFSLEKGILAGFLLFCIGVFIFSYLFISFYGKGIPLLTDTIRFDVAVIGITACLLGIQITFISFVLSLFYIKVK